MGHAIHFLERLERFNDQHTELALALYRDDDLIKHVLASVELPASAERVAVSLDDPELGPFVVLTRSGQFVTCLGKGMRPNGRPVITRERFEIAAGRVQRMRDELARVKQLCQGGGAMSQVKQLLRVLEGSGPRFCREDAAVLARVQPIVAGSLGVYASNMLALGHELLPQVARFRADRLSAREQELMLIFGKAMWTFAHCLPFLSSHETRQLMARLRADEQGELAVLLPSLGFRIGGFAVSARALWAVAHSNRPALHAIRHLPKSGLDFQRRLFRQLSLGAIACASAKARGEALKAMFARIPAPASERATDLVRYESELDQLVGTLGYMMQESLVPQPDEAVEHATHWGRDAARQLVASNTELETRDLPEIPDDVARAMLANLPCSWLAPKEQGKLGLLACSLPWLARASIEELFLPRSWTTALLPELGVEEIQSWLRPYAKLHHLERASQVVLCGPKVQRNEACICGSGMKWKRCCAPERRVRCAVAEEIACPDARLSTPEALPEEHADRSAA